MKDITENFGTLYHPQAALVFYESKGNGNDTYVEYFDMDRNGHPINAHPLTVSEASKLSKALKVAKEEKEPNLKINGILGSHILHLDQQKGKAIWFTKAGQRKLYFAEGLGIPNGEAGVPPMLWAANRNSLFVFALKSNRRPNESTSLYYAPFFNVYENGNVCMGTVNVQIKESASVEEFTAAWEQYFFNSYFSHLNDQNPIKGNCVCLWKDLINTGKHFPKEVLKKTNKTLKSLLP